AAGGALDDLRPAADRDQSGRAAGHLDSPRGLDHLRPQDFAASGSRGGPDRRRHPRLFANRLAASARGADWARKHPPGPERAGGDAQRRKSSRVRDPNLGGAMRRTIWAGLALVTASSPACAQAVDLNALIPAGGATASGRIIELVAILTVLSVAPGLLIMVTSFTRFIVALSFLRTGLGLQTTPANLVLISLSLFMSFFVMAPTFDRAWQNGLKPLMDNTITQQEAYVAVTQPFREFMLAQVRDKDLNLFEDLSKGNFQIKDRSTIDLRLLVPAFMISELRRGFEIGFLIVLPFLVIDMIVATLTMAMGMMMLPPAIISLPVKILFFVLIDGWNLLIGSLVRSAS